MTLDYFSLVSYRNQLHIDLNVRPETRRKYKGNIDAEWGDIFGVRS